jgi:DNA-binding NarL/FixJ family response regulator
MQLSEEEYQLLRELQQNEKHKRNYVKVTVLLMLHLGESEEKISIFLGISVGTISNYKHFYKASGLDTYLESH